MGIGDMTDAQGQLQAPQHGRFCTDIRRRARYRRLPTGAHGLTREEVERDQRERLRSAMVELIAERGYPAVRILDLTQLAHVSRPTFYNLYADKEELLLSAYEDIAGRTTEKVAEAFAEGKSEEQSLGLALQAFAELGAAEPRGDDAGAAGHVRRRPARAGTARSHAARARTDRRRRSRALVTRSCCETSR